MRAESLRTLFGQRVREARVKKGLSQEKLAEHADLHRNYIGDIERAEKSATIDTVEKLSKALGLSVEQLFDYKRSRQ